MEAVENDQSAVEKPDNSYLAPPVPQKPLSKSAQKKLLKQQRFEAKKALMKEQKKKDAERKWKEWGENLASASEEERLKLIESRKSLKKERMERRSEEKEKKKKERLTCGQNIISDLKFPHLATPTEINSLVQQVLTVNQVLEILLKFLERRDWRSSFLQTIPSSKRYLAESEENGEGAVGVENEQKDD